MIKYVLEDLFKEESKMIKRATMLKAGKLTEEFEYLRGYADGVKD